MNMTLKLASLALTATLAVGCTAANDEAPAAAAPAADALPQASSPAATDAPAVQSGSATGTVTALDPAAGKVTIDHGPVPELEWPAMNMGFGATPDQVEQLQVGQRVEFDFEMVGNRATITRIEPAQ